MTPDVVVDVGNTRIKWGRCAPDGIVDTVSLAHDDEQGWTTQLAAWNLITPGTWAISGVAPRQRDRFLAWLRSRQIGVILLDNCRQLPLRVDVDQPEKVGIDRLLNAVAVNSIRSPGAWAGIVDAGTAVTVDCVDPNGVFLGGAILPGLRLMAKALHEHTAQLPQIEAFESDPVPARNTEQALRVGIVHAVAGGVDSLLARMIAAHPGAWHLVVGGGDAAILTSQLSRPTRVWPEMTLEGIRLSAAPNSK